MQKWKPEPGGSRCDCGRPIAEAAVSLYRSHAAGYVFHRGECGAEWTERLEGFDPSEPVTGDEGLAVHEQLAEFKGSLAELISLKPA